MTPEEIVQEQARKLGGGWRVERGVPVVVLTPVEAARIILKLDIQERTIRKAAEEIDRMIEKL